MDESMLTGESDGIRKQTRDEVLSGSFCLNGSGYYEVTAVREDSYAEKVAGEAREFRHPPSPLQEEVNRVIWANTIVLIPLGILVLVALGARDTPFKEAAQTATAGLVTLIPEGLVLLMSVTFAVAAVRLAKQNTLVQQMSATESLAAVDTICVDKTGTLTDGELELVEIVPADGAEVASAERALGRFAASAGERNRTLQVIADRFQARAERPVAEVPFSSVWKWSGLTLNGGSSTSSYVMGAPDILIANGSLELTPQLQASLDEHTAAGRRVVAFAEAPGLAAVRPGIRAAAAPAPDGARRALGAPAPGRRRDDRIHARAAGRSEADLRRRTLDGYRGRIRDRRAEGRRSGRGAGSARRQGSPGRGGAREHDLLPHHAGAEEGARLRDGGAWALHRDDRRWRERRAGAQAGAHGRRDGLGLADHQGSRGHRSPQGPVLDAAARDRRGKADRPQHPPPRPSLHDQVGLRRNPDRVYVHPRLHLSVPSPAPHDRGLPDHRHPLVRPGPRTERGAALPRQAPARAPRFRPTCRHRDRRCLAALVLLRRQPGGRDAGGGTHRRDRHLDRSRPLFHPAARARARAASTSRSRPTCSR